MIATFTVTMHLKSDPTEFEIMRHARTAIGRWGRIYGLGDSLSPKQIDRVIIGPIKKCTEKEIG